jgi:hypothetical protein
LIFLISTIPLHCVLNIYITFKRESADCFRRQIPIEISRRRDRLDSPSSPSRSPVAPEVMLHVIMSQLLAYCPSGEALQTKTRT